MSSEWHLHAEVAIFFAHNLFELIIYPVGKPMNSVDNFETLTYLINENKATMVLFGGEQCGICHAIKPKLDEMIATNFPEMTSIYADCQKHLSLGAQSSVFSLPVVRVYFDGQLFIEEFKAFSLVKLSKDIERPYNTLFN